MPNGKLTTHVLDLNTGLPAAGLQIELWFQGSKIAGVETNGDGRVDAPLLDGDTIKTGIYELVFHAGAYQRTLKESPESSLESLPVFLDEIPIRFGISDVERHYHVPLLLSPYGYSTYRGS